MLLDAMELIKRRAASGEPLVPQRVMRRPSGDTSNPGSTITSPNTSLVTSSIGSEVVKPEKKKIEKLRSFGEKGFKLLETSRQVAAGEREIKLSFAPTGSNTSALVNLLISAYGLRYADICLAYIRCHIVDAAQSWSEWAGHRSDPAKQRHYFRWNTHM